MSAIPDANEVMYTARDGVRGMVDVATASYLSMRLSSTELARVTVSIGPLYFARLFWQSIHQKPGVVDLLVSDLSVCQFT